MIEGNNVEIDAIIEDDSIVLETDLDYRGERGPVGETPDITIGKVDTLSPEDNAYVEKEGTKENITLNFGIPKGETGDIGPVGPTGPSGVYIGSDEPQDPEVDVWIDPTVNPENYVKEKELDDKLNSVIESGELTGPQGPQGIPGKDGIDGKDGVGITTITSGQSTVEDDKTVTPVTVNKTDGSSQIFNVEAKNGIDGKDGLNGKDGVNGQNGQDGITPTIGENGNWYLGDTDTGKPSRGEVGPTPDLTDYVKNTDYATIDKTGVIKARNYFRVSTTGETYVQSMPKEAYKDTGDTAFISKGTLENIKNDYVGSSQPVQDLNNSLRDLTPKQDAERTDNVFDDGLERPLFALGGDGKSEQVVTQGYNLIGVNDVEETTKNGLTYSIKNGLLKLNGTANALVPLGNILFNIPAEAGKYRFEIFPQNGTWKSGWLGVRGYIDGTQKWYQQIAKTNNTNYVINDRTVEELDGCNRCDVYVASGSTFDNFRCYIQLKKGAEHSPYEPYSNGIPSPSPDYEQPINSIEGNLEFACRGKNIFTKKSSTQTSNGITNVFKDNTLTYNGTATLNYSNCVPTGSFKITKGTYTFSITNPLDTSISMRFQKTIDYNSGSFEARINKGETSVTFTLPDDFNYFYFYLNTIEGDTYSGHTSMQMEKGTQATDYEPYIEPNEVTFNLNEEKLRSVGTVKDELVVDLFTGDYYKVENVGEVVLNGSESWWLQSINEYGIANFKYTTGKELYPINFNVMSNYFASQNTSISQTKTNGIFMQWQNELYIRIEQEKASTVEEFKQWLSTHTTIVNYQLATSTTKKLGTLSAEDLAKLKTFKGYNNVTVNTNLGLMNIRFTYCLDIKKYIDNKIAELSAQLIKGE